VADFGFTTRGSLAGQLIASSKAHGTDGYRAPELVSSDRLFDYQADIWAIGCVFYEVVTRKKAFFFDDEFANSVPPINPSLHYAHSAKFYESIISQTIQMDPSKRSTVTDLLESFLEFEEELRTPVTFQHVKSSSRRKKCDPCRENKDLITVTVYLSMRVMKQGEYYCEYGNEYERCTFCFVKGWECGTKRSKNEYDRLKGASADWDGKKPPTNRWEVVEVIVLDN
jgi:serine/threonine protein kinase